jgi:hypothetical protein
MIVGNAFSNCNGSSAFSAHDVIGLINVTIWNKKIFNEVSNVSLTAGTHLCIAFSAAY